eukprot:TRINITY_DN1977_c0_g1_i4.p1 TRINITY_DN1977_c0_g1~~TRINITY_DN1977_c0_g1_i4.p1  ORF type:complete len:277 (-),score=26.69 TRINITY_DN1977_c0_g1_i4:96-872(-)
MAIWNYALNALGEDTFAWSGTFFVHEVTYFVIGTLFIFVDMIPAFHKFKIQQDKPNSLVGYWKCIRHLLFLHFAIQLPMVLLTTKPLLTWLGMSLDWHHAPTLWNLVETCIISMLIEDTYFYWMHRALHTPFLYKRIHKVHHEHTAPHGLAGEYAHPAETFLLGIGTMLGPILCARHLLSLWAWLVVRVVQVVVVHSGYDFPWSVNRWVNVLGDWWGGAAYHDYHHKTFLGPYASTFTWWDRMCGTDRSFRLTKGTTT